MSQLGVFLVCSLLLTVRESSACLPTGIGGILGGGEGDGCASRPGGCAAVVATHYAAPMPPPIYGFTPQVLNIPPPPPAPARQLPSEVTIPVSAASSYQGMYQDKPHAPSINPEYQGTAPLSFVGDVSASNDAENTVVDPLKYIEHVSVSHTPSIQAGNQGQEAYQPNPADPFGAPISPEEQITIKQSSEPQQQIQVAPSSASTEDTYFPGPTEKDAINATRILSTYYNQICSGEKIAVGDKETISSATKKCELLNCVAANAQPDRQGSYTVTYLSTATSRSNSKGHYCLSSIELPLKSKRVIRKFNEMMTSEEETNAVRRKIFKL